MTEKKNSTNAAWTDIFRKQIFIPIAALLILAVFNLIVDPSFFKITLGHKQHRRPGTDRILNDHSGLRF